MKTISVNLVQPRVDNVFGAKQSVYYIVTDCVKEVYIIPADELKDWTGYGCETVAKALVNHPAIMAGSYEEIRSDIVYAVEQEAVKAGILDRSEVNDMLYVK